MGVFKANVFFFLQKKKGKKEKEKKVAATYDIPTPEGEKKGEKK